MKTLLSVVLFLAFIPIAPIVVYIACNAAFYLIVGLPFMLMGIWTIPVCLLVMVILFLAWYYA